MENHTAPMIAKEFDRKSLLILPARTTLLFFAATVLLYLLAGLYLQTAWGLWGIFLNQALFLFLPTLALSYAKEKPIFDWPNWRWPGLLPLLLTAISILVLSLGVDHLLSYQDHLWPPPPAVQDFYEKLVTIHSLQEGVAKVLILALTPAFAEEIFFRGLLQPSWVARFGKKWGIALTAFAFALVHGNFWHFHFYFILGIFLGVSYESQASLWLPILAHFLNNLWTLFVQ